ncbi:unnamed protein product [Schistosoma rodhaini]|nr:unnamed protein product [Schistosoma rodhaini]
MVPSHLPTIDHQLRLLGPTAMAVACIYRFSLIGTAGTSTHIGPHRLSCLASMHFAVVNLSFLRYLCALPDGIRVSSYAASLSGPQPPNFCHHPARPELHMCSLSVFPFAEATLLPPCPLLVCQNLPPLLSL